MNITNQGIEKAQYLIIIYNSETDAVFHHHLTTDKTLVKQWESLKEDCIIYQKGDLYFFDCEADRDFFIKHPDLWQFVSKVDISHNETYDGETLLQKVIKDYEFSWATLTDQQEDFERDEAEEETRFRNDLLEMYPVGKVI